MAPSKAAKKTKKGTAPVSSDPNQISKRSQWTVEDEALLAAFLDDHRSEAGDGMSFKATIWTAAAAEMVKSTTKGGPKDAVSCKNKWAKVFHYFYL